MAWKRGTLKAKDGPRRPAGGDEKRPLHERTAAELAGVPDARIIEAYEALRDASTPAGERPAYPNIRRLFATPFEREKDRREIGARLGAGPAPEMQAWYEEAAGRPCTWWLDNHIVARHALKCCLSCGICVSLCPAAEYYETYNPRRIVDTALARDEEQLVELLSSETLWYCGQCGSCKPQCPRENNIMGLVSSLRFLAQLKGYHLRSVRGRQQYAARHLWGGNFWNRACSMYFRNPDPETHPDFGPRFARYRETLDEEMRRVGASPDEDGLWGGRKVHPGTLEELRRCVQWGGTLAFWRKLEEHARADAADLGVDLDEYHDWVKSEG